MKKNFLGLIACLAAAMLSCSDNSFDFSHLNEIDAEGNWGIPVTSVEYSIEDILNMADNIPITTGTDGTLQLEYATEVDSIICSDRFLKCLSSQEITEHKSMQFDLPTMPTSMGVPFSLINDTVECVLPSDEVRVESAKIKSGLLAFTMTHNCPASLQVVVECSQLHDASNHVFSQTFNIQSGIENQISLAGFSVSPMATNTLRFRISVSGTTNGNAISGSASLAYDLAVRHIIFEELSGRVDSYTTDFSESVDLNLDYLARTMGGSFTLYNPDIRCEVHNMFPVGAHIVMNEAALHGPNVPAASLLATTPAAIDVPASTQQFEQVALPIASAITFRPQMNEASVSANITINPNGFNGPVLNLREGQYIHVRISFKLPMHLKIDNLTFHDTLDFSQVNFPDIEGISNMAMRCIFENTLPLNLTCQAYFYDETTHTIRDSLFHSSHLIVGCYGTEPTLFENYITIDNMEDLRNLLSCNKIILDAKVKTDGHQVCIRNDQKLRILMGANFNLNLNDLAGYITN